MDIFCHCNCDLGAVGNFYLIFFVKVINQNEYE